MQVKLYNVDNWVDTWYDTDMQIVFVKWFNFTSGIHVRKSCEAQLEALKKFKATIIIADASQAIGMPYPEDQDWFESTLYPESKRLGLKLIISIMPKNTIAKIGARNWNNSGTDSGLNYIEVDSMDKALLYLKTQNISG
ncbi:MAG: hypothetical protein V4677_01610 [Bacteroidota bacterium]